MNEATNDLCRCNPCAGPQCDCGCQQKAATRESSAGTACACGPQCRCGGDCGCGDARRA